MTQAPTPGPLTAAIDMLSDARDFIDRFSDVIDGDYGTSEPNAAMVMVHEINATIDHLSAPTAPVEASGSELARWIASAKTPFAEGGLGDDLYKRGSAYLADYVLSTDGADHEPNEFERAMLEDAFAGLMQDEALFGPIRTLLCNLRPRPSGETPLGGVERDTRPLIERLKTWANHHANSHTRSLLLEAAETLSPAPVASGGQHSSGEGDKVEMIADLIEKYTYVMSKHNPDMARVGGHNSCAQHILAALSTTPARAEAPVAETAGEAVVWIDPTDIDHLLEGNPLTTTLFPYETRDATKPLYAAPVPAQDDDKLRIARKTDDCPECGVPPFHLHKDDCPALAALKSTAAQEGGE